MAAFRRHTNETDPDFASRSAGTDPDMEIDEYGSVNPKFVWDAQHEDGDAGAIQDLEAVKDGLGPFARNPL